MDAATQKFLPPPDMPAFHRPFWQALKAHRLELQSCEHGHLRFIPLEICPACGSQTWSWRHLSGRGKVYTYTIVHRGPTPAYQQDAPYVIAHVELEEGPRMISNLITGEPSSVHIGMDVEIVFEDVTDEWTLYKFAPRRTGGMSARQPDRSPPPPPGHEM